MEKFKEIVYKNSKDGICDIVSVANNFKTSTEDITIRFLRLFP